jgi:hypothetical protein
MNSDNEPAYQSEDLSCFEIAELSIEITVCYHEFGSKLIFDSWGSARKLLTGKEFGCGGRI